MIKKEIDKEGETERGVDSERGIVRERERDGGDEKGRRKEEIKGEKKK